VSPLVTPTLVAVLLGAPAQVVPSGEQCMMPDDNGVWRPCEDVLAEREPPPPTEVAPAEPDEPRGGRVDPPLHAEPKAKKPSARRGYSAAFPPTDAPPDEDAKRAAIVGLRAEVAALAQQREDASKHRGDPARAAELDKLDRDVRVGRATLEYVEQLGWRLVRDCIFHNHKDLIDAYAPAKPYRMTPAGPIKLRPDEMRQLPSADPPGCERTTLVTDEMVAKARRLQEIVDTLENKRFDWRERNVKKQLAAEREQLLRDLDDPSMRVLRGLRPRGVSRRR
jgi:hypothetical protein